MSCPSCTINEVHQHLIALIELCANMLCGRIRWSAVNVHDCHNNRGKQRTSDITNQTKHSSLASLLPFGAGAVAVARIKLD
jgi:hypothetical protein